MNTKPLDLLRTHQLSNFIKLEIWFTEVGPYAGQSGLAPPGRIRPTTDIHPSTAKRSVMCRNPWVSSWMIVPLAATFSTQISPLRAEAIVKVADMLPELVQQSRGAQKKRAWFHRIFMTVFLHSSSSNNPGCKPFSGGSRAQNIPHRPAYPASSAGYITLGFCRYSGICTC